MIKLHKVINDDSIRIVEDLAEIIWNECYSYLLSKEQINYMLDKFLSSKAIKKNLEDNYFFYFISYNNEIAGFTSYKKEDDNTIFLSKLYILEKYRGKHLSSFVINFLKQQNCDIYLTVNKYNEKALNTYKHFGFEIIDSVISDIGNNYVMDDYIMKYYNK